MKLYKQIMTTLRAYRACRDGFGHKDWTAKHLDRLRELMTLLPSGSGFDTGTQIEQDDNNDDRIVLKTSYHHMNEHGFYRGWSEHTIIVKPDLVHDFELRIVTHTTKGLGVDQSWRDYAAEVFTSALTREV